MWDTFADNAVVQVFAMQSPYEYVYESIMFLYVLEVLSGVGGARNWVAKLGYTFLRGFGSLYFVVPLVLGRFPNEFIVGIDGYIKFYICTVLFALLAYRVPSEVWDTLFLPRKIAYAIFLGNACATAVEQGAAASNGIGYVAPCLVGFLGVMGHRIVERGLVEALRGAEYDEDMLLAVFGPAIYMGLTNWYVPGFMNPVSARVMLVLFRLSAEYVDYNEVLNYFDSVRANAITRVSRSAGGSPRRRR